MIRFEICHSYSNYGQSKKETQNGKKSICSMGYSLWYIKIEPSQI